MTSRWLLEVEKVRPVHVEFHVMSLSALNEGRSSDPEVVRAVESGWLAAWTAIAVRDTYGQQGLRDFYTAIGTRYHPGRQTKGDPEVIKAALRDCGFDEGLVDEAATGKWDAELRESHHEGMDPVGQEVGTPVLHLNDKAIFGPVISPAPKGEEAGRLFDGVALVMAADGFFELKRSRYRDPIFD
jgi:hypothetical protein